MRISDWSSDVCSSDLLVLSDDQGRERARHRIPYGAKMLVDDGTKVEPGHRMAEWDPYTIPILTEREGIAHYVDLVDGVSMREVTDEATGISSRVVVDWKQQPRGNDLRSEERRVGKECVSKCKSRWTTYH